MSGSPDRLERRASLAARSLHIADPTYVGLLVAAAGIFYLAPWAPIYVPALVLVVVLSYCRLDLALVLVVFFAPLYMLPKHLGHEEFAPSEIFILIGLIVALAWWVSPERRARLAWDRLRHSPFLWPAILVLCAGAVSTVFAADRHVALRAFRETLLEPILFFGLVVLLCRHSGRWRWLLLSVIGSGLLVACVGLIQYATNQDLTSVAGSSIPRIRSVYGSPDNLGLLLDRALPLCLAFYLAARRSVWERSAFLLTGAILTSVLVLTFSRGAWVATPLAILFMLFLAFRRGTWLVMAAVVLALLAAVVAGPKITHAVSSGHSGTVQTRLYIWRSAARMIEHRPLTGVGPDNFLHYYAPHPGQLGWGRWNPCPAGLGYMDPHVANQPCLSHPHDAVLDFWLSTGILGLGAFIWLEIVFWRACVAAYHRASGELRLYLLGVMGAMAASFIHGLVDNSYFLMDLAILFWLLCGFASFAVTDRPAEVTRPAINPEAVRAVR